MQGFFAWKSWLVRFLWGCQIWSFCHKTLGGRNGGFKTWKIDSSTTSCSCPFCLAGYHPSHHQKSRDSNTNPGIEGLPHHMAKATYPKRNEFSLKNKASPEIMSSRELFRYFFCSNQVVLAPTVKPRFQKIVGLGSNFPATAFHSRPEAPWFNPNGKAALPPYTKMSGWKVRFRTSSKVASNRYSNKLWILVHIREPSSLPLWICGFSQLTSQFAAPTSINIEKENTFVMQGSWGSLLQVERLSICHYTCFAQRILEVTPLITVLWVKGV